MQGNKVHGNLERWLTILVFAFALISGTKAYGQGRLAPSKGVKCDPNHLTSFTGRILDYRRTPEKLSLRMHTDEETTESFTLRFRKTQSPATWFLINGEPFKASDWRLIERSRYHLRPRMRATVWVCDDGSKPIVDWRPGEGQTKTVY